MKDARQWASLLGLVAVGLAVYANGLGGEFCYDENIVILRNDNVQDPARIGALWTDSYWGDAVPDELDSGGWRPLTIFSFHLDHRMGGDDPFVYHLVNVILHVAVSCLLFVCLVRLRLDMLVALVASALFAVHAVHTEAVTQIVGRAELIAALGAFGALTLHLEAHEREGSVRWLLVGLAALAFFLGLLGKESAVAFLALVPASDLLASRGFGLAASIRRAALGRWRAWLVYALPVVAFLVARHVLFGRAFPAGDVHFVDNPTVLLHPLARPFGALLVWGKASGLLLLPAALSADYGYAQLPVDTFWTSGWFWWGIASLVLGTWAVAGPLRSDRGSLWGWLVLLAAWLPFSNALFPIHTVFGERTLYIPSAGFCVLAASALVHLARRHDGGMRAAAVTGIALLVAFNAVRTPLRNRDWTDDLALFEATSRVSTRSVRVLNNHGNVLYTRGDLEGAEQEYREALDLFPGYDDAAVNLAGVLMRRGENDEARALLEEVLARSPGHPTALANMKLLNRLEGGPQGSTSPRSAPPRMP